MITLFGLFANQTRLRLLLALFPPGQAAPELCVCDLAAIAGASVSMTSHQLRLLMRAGLVKHRRSGKMMLYRLTEGPQSRVLVDALEHVSACT